MSSGANVSPVCVLMCWGFLTDIHSPHSDISAFGHIPLSGWWGCFDELCGLTQGAPEFAWGHTPRPKYYSQSATLSLWRPALTDRHEGEVQSDGPLWSSKSAGITRVCRWVCVCYWPVSPTLDPFIWIFEAKNAHFRGFLHLLGNLESKIKWRQRQRLKSFGWAMLHVC